MMPHSGWFVSLELIRGGYSLVWGLNGQYSQMELSRHLEQTSPGLISVIFMAVSPMSVSSDLVIGFPIYQANRRNVALPI